MKEHRRDDTPRVAAGPAPSARSRRTRRESGFTLMELMVVVAIIGILVSMAVPTYRTAVERTKETVLRQNLSVIRDCIDQYYADKGRYPDSIEALVSEGYLRHLPVDPITEKSDWVTVPYTGAEEGQLEPTEGEEGGGGIWDVHSASEGTARDGSKFSEW
ncbi:MAG: type IV pilin protein [Acidobacteriota bacterium]